MPEMDREVLEKETREMAGRITSGLHSFRDTAENIRWFTGPVISINQLAAVALYSISGLYFVKTPEHGYRYVLPEYTEEDIQEAVDITETMLKTDKWVESIEVCGEEYRQDGPNPWVVFDNPWTIEEIGKKLAPKQAWFPEDFDFKKLVLDGLLPLWD